MSIYIHIIYVCVFIYTHTMHHTHIMQTKTFILDLINRLTALLLTCILVHSAATLIQ